jgi:hypothetical protein
VPQKARKKSGLHDEPKIGAPTDGEANTGGSTVSQACSVAHCGLHEKFTFLPFTAEKQTFHATPGVLKFLHVDKRTRFTRGHRHLRGRAGPSPAAVPRISALSVWEAPMSMSG